MKKILRAFAIFLLNFAIKVIIGAGVFNKIQEIVIEANKNKDWTGEQKKEFVKQEIKKLGIAMKKSATNLAIETAVSKLKGMAE
jgi:hypothetical protein